MQWAFLAVLKHITGHGESARYLTRLLARSFHDDIVYIFSGIVRIWLECVSQQVQAGLSSKGKVADMGRSPSAHGAGDRGGILPAVDGVKSTYGRERDRLFRKVVGVDAVAHNILKFATQLAAENAAMRAGMLESGAAVLVLAAFANDDFTMSDLLCLTKQGKRKTMNTGKKEPTSAPLSLAAINAEASTLSLLLYQPVFRAGWEAQRLQTRLALSAVLVNALFSDNADGRYDVTRALFRKIIDAHV